MEKQFYVYILAIKRNGTLYVGMTNNLVRRVYEHKQKLIEGFTQHHNVTMLVHFETVSSPQEAINREKQLKAGLRRKKILLIEQTNPEWKDLYGELII
jgi:putative endonuclease